MKLETPVYLGDAVYAHFDGFGIELRLNAHNSLCAVYLEPAVFVELQAFVERIKNRDLELK